MSHGSATAVRGTPRGSRQRTRNGRKRMRSTTLAVGVLACTLALPAATANSQTVLNVNAWVPPSHLLVADVTMPLCKDIEQATAGRVKCNLLPKAVVGAPQTLDAVKDGLARSEERRVGKGCRAVAGRAS